MSENTLKWEKYAQKHLAGKKIVSARYMTKEEMNNTGWDRRALIIQLDDNTLIFPSQDDEGNGPGAIFGQDSKGESLTFPVLY